MASAEHRGVDDIGPIGLWSDYPELTGSKLFNEFIHRLVIGRDLHVIITAASETGVGKTTLGVVLALFWDQHGWTHEKASVASGPKYDVLYDEVPPGSVVILDEAEKAVDARRGSSKANVGLSQAFAAKRYRQVFGIMTAPTKGWVDKRLGSDAADYWIQTQETDQGRPKGEARVYRLKSNEHYQSDYTPKTETISWPVLDDHPEFKWLEQRKKEKLEGALRSSYVHRDEVDEMKKNWWNKATKQTGYQLAKAALAHGYSQTMTAELFSMADIKGFSQPQISRLKETEDFEEWYYDE